MTSDAIVATPEARRQPWLVAYYRAGWNASWQGLPRELPMARQRPAGAVLAGWAGCGRQLLDHESLGRQPVKIRPVPARELAPH